MNTTLAYNHKSIRKMINHSLYFTVLLSVFCSQSFLINNNLFASEAINNGANIKQNTVEEQTRSLTEEKQRWESMLRQRYRNGALLTIADGVKHVRMVKYINGRPVKINIVEVNTKLNPNIEIAPQLASTNLKRRATIRTIASRNNSIAAVNGTYFKPQTGVPLGTLMINEKMYTGPVYDRVAMGIFDDGFDIARISLNASVTGSGKTIKVDNINQPRMLSTHVIVYTPEWGKYSPAAPKYGVGLQVTDDKITTASANAVVIPQNGYVISGPKSILYALLDKKDALLDVKTTPEWKGVKHIISGGPYLVKDGEVLLIQNTRYEKGETKNDPELSKEWASLGDGFVMDAFGSAHRAHASTFGVPEEMKNEGKPTAVGYLVEKEVKSLSRCVKADVHPYIAILGGFKVSDKIKVIESLLKKTDKILIGGAMAYTFLKALGKGIGTSPCELDQLDYAKKCYETGKIVLPVDAVVTDKFEEGSDRVIKTVEGDIPDGFEGMDIGPKTIELFKNEIAKAKLIFWNGPTGVFEQKEFQTGTIEVCKAITENKDCFSVIGGGDSAAAAKQFGYKDKFSHVSTGGGASLEMIENDGHLPGIDVIG